MASISKDRDLELWKKWKRSKSPMDLQPLLTQMAGILNKEVNRWSGVLARDVLFQEAEVLAKEAFETYDPKMGAALSTHVTNRLQKLSRTVYSHQNLARIPEHGVLKIQVFNRAHTELENSLGRAPSNTELAEQLAWSHAAVEKLRKEMRRESIESLDTKNTPVHGPGDGEAMVHLMFYDLNPTEQAIFSAKTGYGGAPVLSGQELQKKLNMTQGQISYTQTKMINKIKGMTG